MQLIGIKMDFVDKVNYALSYFRLAKIEREKYLAIIINMFLYGGIKLFSLDRENIIPVVKRIIVEDLSKDKTGFVIPSIQDSVRKIVVKTGDASLGDILALFRRENTTPYKLIDSGVSFIEFIEDEL